MNETGGEIKWILTANDTDFDRTADRVERRSETLGRNVDRNINKGTKGANKGLREFRTEMAQTASLVRNFQVAMRGFNMTSIVVAAVAAGGAVTELASALIAAGQVAIAAPGLIAPLIGAYGTLTTALSGLGKAFGDVGNAELFAKDLEKLTPPARDLALAFKDVYTEFVPIQEEIQKALFKDLGQQMKEVATVILPVLKTGMIETATAMNGLAKEAARVAKEPFFQKLIADTLSTTAKATNTLTQAVEPLARATAGLIEVGLPYTNMLAEWIVQQSKLFAAYTTSAKGQEELTNAINLGITALQTLGSLIGSTLGFLVTIFETSSQAGVSLINTLSGIIDQMNAWLKTTEGQKEFVALMNLTNNVITTLADVVGSALGVLFDLIEAFNELPDFVQKTVITMLAFIAVITPVITYVSALGGSFNTVIQIFDDFGGPLLTVVAALGALAFVMGSTSDSAQQFQGLLEGIPKAVQNFVNSLPQAIAGVTDFVVGMLNTIAAGLPKLIDLGGQILSSLITGITNVLPSLIASVGTILVQVINIIVANLPAVVNLGVQLIVSLVNGLLGAIPQLLSTAVTLVSSLVDAIIQTIPMLLEAGLQLVLGLVQGIISNLPAIIDAAIAMVDNLVKAIVKIVPQIVDAGFDLLTALINGITKALPQILQGAVKIVETLVEGLISLIPTLIPAVIQLMTGLLNAIIQNLPIIIKAGVELLKAIVTGITNSLPQIVNGIVVLVATLTNALIDNLPMVIEATVTLINALTKAIIDNLPLIVDATIQITLAIVNALIDNLPMLINAAVTIVLTLADALIENLPTLIGAGITLMSTLVGALISFGQKLFEAGVTLIVNLGLGIIKAIPQALLAVAEVIGNLIIGLGNSIGKFIEAGGNLVTGLVKGIDNAKNAVVNKVKEIASSALDAIKKFFGIHSPSRVMAQMGDYLMQGFKNGIVATGREVIATSSKIAGGIADAFAQPLAPQSLVATTSLNTDVASVSGLNRTVGSDISNSSNTASSTAGGVTINQTNNVNTELDMDKVNRDLTWELMKV